MAGLQPPITIQLVAGKCASTCYSSGDGIGLTGVTQGIERAWEVGIEAILCAFNRPATPGRTGDNPLTFALPAFSCKKITAAFDGGRPSPDSGAIPLLLAERRRGISRNASQPDRRSTWPDTCHAHGLGCARDAHAGDCLRLSRRHRFPISAFRSRLQGMSSRRPAGPKKAIVARTVTLFVAQPQLLQRVALAGRT